MQMKQWIDGMSLAGAYDAENVVERKGEWVRRFNAVNRCKRVRMRYLQSQPTQPGSRN